MRIPKTEIEEYSDSTVSMLPSTSRTRLRNGEDSSIPVHRYVDRFDWIAQSDKRPRRIVREDVDPEDNTTRHAPQKCR